MKIVFLDTDTFGDAFELEQFQDLGEVEHFAFTREEDTMSRIEDASVIVTNKVRITREQISQCKKLHLICIAATGMDHVDVIFAESRGVLVKNAVGYSTDSVAEITVSLALALKNQLKYYDRYSEKDYKNSHIFTHIGPGFRLIKNQKVGIIGLGNIGKEVATLFSMMGAEIGYYSISKNKQDVAYTFYNDLPEFLANHDIITLHCPLTSASRNLINQESLKSCKRSAFLINVSRGAVVNEQDLVSAIKEKHIAGAAIDVFETEPIAADSPFNEIASYPNVMLSPHIAWAAIEARKRLMKIIGGHIKENTI